METVLWGHPEREVPFCAKQYRVLDEVIDNHQAQNIIRLEQPVTTKRLRIEGFSTGTPIHPSVFAIQIAAMYKCAS
jgi:hypothetical protein